jgi:hypothetical protein
LFNRQLLVKPAAPLQSASTTRPDIASGQRLPEVSRKTTAARPEILSRAASRTEIVQKLASPQLRDHWCY